MTASGTEIVVAGAGMAGLTAAIALARRGFQVTVIERAPVIEDAGAGLQLSPNATRILDGLGVFEGLTPHAVRPEAIELRRASDFKTIACVPLGQAAEARWGAPYLTVHRSHLQRALLARATSMDAISLVTGAEASAVSFQADGAAVTLRRDGATETMRARLVIGADGVGSKVRPQGPVQSLPFTAWRSMLPVADADGAVAANGVTAFLHPKFHLVAYPVSGGDEINLVAFTRTQRRGDRRDANADDLLATLSDASPALAALAHRAGRWKPWPLEIVDPSPPWTDARGLALIGDAAHAMTPFAAQGAAMAIEDAAVLARELAGEHDIATALKRYEATRRPRVAQVAARGRFNRFVWHAAGPVALGRDMVLRLRHGERLMADFDWLYGWKPDSASAL